MVIDELKESFVDLDADVRSYIEENRKYYQLKTFKILMKGITSLTKTLFVGGIIFLMVLLLSIGASLGIGQALDNMFYGFLIVSLFFVFVGIIGYIFRDKLDRPILKKFSEYYFDET